jgi:UDP-N-acetylglucosamine acyltransferase
MTVNIHPTAVIEPGAELGVDVRVGPYTVIGPRVKVGDRTRIGAHVVLDGVTSIGVENIIVGQASIGGPPQDLTYRGEPKSSLGTGTPCASSSPSTVARSKAAG